METFAANPRSAASLRSRRRWPVAVGAAVGTVLVILGGRFVNGGLNVFERVAQESCGNGFCVQRIHSPELLLVPGYDVVTVWQEGNPGRMYSSGDPFDEYSEVVITWEDGGVTVSDGGPARLSWTADSLARLND
ncbi:hypothetical protein [Kineosporia sp. NBRC 101731]|uniref:hypothetical protein n=1 Tax=Kineosporia sp. NBRC 101731 TaxID=3032199 RepID=UPI0024A55961|nr:hypothetical protein [Kineosporia sp. NBRC 101731]GLY27760.1 hypothetical protein Kisp02_11250 [Kineosporia sp. NBRC 101731]